MHGPVSAEVTAVDFDGMMKEAHDYAKFAPNVVVKVPLILEGLQGREGAAPARASAPT